MILKKDYLYFKSNRNFIGVLFCLFGFLYSCSKESIQGSNINSINQIIALQTFGGSKNDTFQSIKNTLDGGYIVVGHSQSSDFDVSTKNNDSYDYWVLKFDEDENLEWSKTFGGSDDDRARDVIQLNDGSFVVTGFSRSNDLDVSANAGNYDYWLIKLDTNGTLLWEKSFGFSGSDQSYVIKKTTDGNLLLGGSLDVTASGGLGNSKTASKHAGGDYWLLKLDTNGNSIWTKYFGGLFTDTLLDIAETNAGDYILTGFSDSSDTNISNNLGSYDYWIVKVNTNGNLVWEKSFGGSEIDEAYSITKTSNNQFLIVGNARSSDKNVTINNGSSDIWVITIDEAGNLIWGKSFGGSSFEDAKKVIASTSGGFYIVGSSRSSDKNLTENKGNKDIWVLKISDIGDLIWQKSIGGTELDEANSIIELNTDIFIVGESWSSDQDISNNKGFSDGVLIKMN